jgi:thiamine biosynthesis lipoprotein
LSIARALPVLFLLFLPNPVLTEDILYEVSVSKFLMGTSVETTARHPDINACREALFLAYREMERVESLLSFHNPESEVSKINNQAGVKPVAVSAETYDIIDRAKGHARELDGLFDLSIGALSERWGFNHDRETTLPGPEEIATLRVLVDFRQIILDPADTTVFLRSPGMKIDLGGIAKGYAIDRGVAVLRENGVQHFF